MNKNKPAGADGFVIEMLVVLYDFGIDKIIEIINEIYRNGDIREKLSRSFFITLSMKLGAN